MRNSSMGLSAAAPTIETNTKSAPTALIASIRLALPSRSTAASESRGPMKPCTAEIATSTPGGRRSEAGAIPHVAGHHLDVFADEVPGASRVASQDPDAEPRV